MALTIVDRLAIGIGHRQARDCHRLASKWIPTVLEVEESPSVGPTLHIARGCRSNPQNEPSQSPLDDPYSGDSGSLWYRAVQQRGQQEHNCGGGHDEQEARTKTSQTHGSRPDQPR